jgi:hypothetical protein
MKFRFYVFKSYIFSVFVPFYNKIKMSVDFVNALKTPFAKVSFRYSCFR